jgi:competence protein ComEA
MAAERLAPNFHHINTIDEQRSRDFAGARLAIARGGPGSRDVLRCPTNTAMLNVPRQGPSRIPRVSRRITMSRRLLLSTFLSLALCSTGPIAAQTAPKAAKASTKPAKPVRVVAAASTAVINLNTASATEIASLPGIGAKTAELIVEYRQKNGPFKKVEEIMNVRGVGEKSFLKLKSRISVGAQKAE